MAAKKKCDERSGWEIGESIFLELDILLNILTGSVHQFFLEDMALQKLGQIPKELRSDLNRVIPRCDHLILILTRMATPPDCFIGSNYKDLSLILRKMTPQDLLKSHEILLEPFGLTADTSLPIEKALADLILKGDRVSSEKLGLFSNTEYVEKEVRYEVEVALKIIKGGQWEYEFWHVMDRIYYEFYHPWKVTQQHVMEAQKKEALANLGSMKSPMGIPDLEWLKGRQLMAERQSVMNGLKEIPSKTYFIITPFKYFDLSYFIPGSLLITISQNAFSSDELKENISQIVRGAKAISDPTRLTILRLIRNSGMYSTELASLLNLARPTVSEHCRILREAELIETYPDGRKSYHKLRPENVKKLFLDIEGFLEISDSMGIP